MKEILISIQPQWVEKILNGEKTIEIRKTMPKCDLPAKVYIYCTKAIKFKDIYLHELKKVNDKYELGLHGNNIMNGKVVAEFTLNNIDDFSVFENGSVQYWSAHNLEKSALTYEEVSKYVGLNKKGYAWHISDLKVYDEPKKLSEFKVFNKDVAEIGMFGWMFNEEELPKYIPLKRAPQSWQYVNYVDKE